MPYTDGGTGYQTTDTSQAAAQAVEPTTAPLQGRVLDYLLRCPQPVSTETIARALDRAYSGIQPRLTELRAKGLVEDSGERGRTCAGRSCILWQVTWVAREAAPWTPGEPAR